MQEPPSHARYVSSVRKVVGVCPERRAGAAAEQWLATFAGLSRAQLERALWHGGIFVDGRRCPEPLVLGAGSEVKIYVFDREPECIEVERRRVLFEDEHWVAVDKPAWLPVQGTRASRRISLETQLRELIGSAWLSPVHRLDRQTSGVNLFAKTPAAFEAAARQFRARRAHKVYLARVSRLPAGDRWTVRAYLRQAPHPSHAYFETHPVPQSGARESLTEFRVRSRARGWVEARPLTGRTHQIRLHLAFATGPIAGDTLYGEAWTPGAPERVLLHSERLTLAHPNGGTLAFEAPVPPAFQLPLTPPRGVNI